MQQFGAFAFYTVVRWHKLSEVASEYTLHISIVLAICVLKIIKFGGDLTKFWQKQVGSFMAHPLYTPCFKNSQNCFCHNYVKFLPILIIFGNEIVKKIKLCKMHLFSISSNLCQRTTVWNADQRCIMLCIMLSCCLQ